MKTIFNGTRTQNLEKLRKAISNTGFEKAKQAKKPPTPTAILDFLTIELPQKLYLERVPVSDMLHLNQTGFEAPKENPFLGRWPLRSLLSEGGYNIPSTGQNWKLRLPEIKDTTEFKKNQQELNNQHPPLPFIAEDGIEHIIPRKLRKDVDSV